MLRFSWKKLKNSAAFDMLEIYKKLCIAEGVQTTEVRITKKELGSMIKLPYGDSYLLDLKSLLLDSSSLQDKMQYIDLASKRNFFDYRINKDKTLDALLVKRDTIKHNTLLTIVNNKIHFKFEENNSGIKFQ